MLKNLKITAKLGLGFGLVLLLFSFAVFFSWKSISGVQGEINFLKYVIQSVSLTNDMNITVSYIRAGIRDLRFTESEDDITNLQHHFDDLRPQIEALKKLYVTVPRIDILAKASDIERTLNNSTANLAKVISMIRTKRAAVKRLDEDIAKIRSALNEVVRLQYQRMDGTIDDIIAGNIEQEQIRDEINRKVERIREIEEAANQITHAAWQYQQGMQYRDIKTLNDVVKEISDLQTGCENFAARAGGIFNRPAAGSFIWRRTATGFAGAGTGTAAGFVIAGRTG